MPVAPKKRKLSFSALKSLRSRDKQFQRHMKAITNGEVETDPESNEFVQKYQSAHSVAVKKTLRDLWSNAGRDFKGAGMILRARRIAIKEDLSEGMWLSVEQLEDEFKSKEHAMNYKKFAMDNGLEKKDPKRLCNVYYYEKKLSRWCRREEGCMEVSKKEEEEQDSDDDLESDTGVPTDTSSESVSEKPSKRKNKKDRKATKKHKKANKYRKEKKNAKGTKKQGGATDTDSDDKPAKKEKKEKKTKKRTSMITKKDTKKQWVKPKPKPKAIGKGFKAITMGNAGLAPSDNSSSSSISSSSS